ncbi:MAG: RNA methyltransferase [Proteobacteria bacterium]|nr:RNA methyltransferase [Desulfobulbaceae bacterium]MBU4151403.1 RNA methyltransferase [Pseudomonadota bacterium]MDP2104590.1 RNA methyltransferase [Desulfobulbaceae bacterium]
MLDIALVHYPVCNAKKEIIGAAVTNLDIHDIARAGRSYGVDNFFIITPFADQQKLVGEIIDHWRTGYGAQHNPDRREAFSIVSICPSLEELYSNYSVKGLSRPMVVATSAKVQERTLEFAVLRQRLADGEHILLLFGTGSGLTPEVMAAVDVVLPPVGSRETYNHLSVRSACSIVLDRLLGVL